MSINALLAAVAFLAAVMVYYAVFPPKAPKGSRLEKELLALSGMKAPGLGLFEGRPLLDRAFGPFLAEWGTRLRFWLKNEEKVRERLQAAGWPRPFRTVNDFYAAKVAGGIILFAAGLGFALLLGFGGFAIPLAVGLGALGFFLPDLSVEQQAKRRAEEMTVEMAFVPDRLAIYLAAGHALPYAIRRVAERPGGPFTEELRKVALDYETGGDIREALENMVERNPGLEDVAWFASSLTFAQEQGAEMVPVLRSMGEEARKKLNNILNARGHRTTLLLIIPVGLLIVPASLLLVGAPGFVRAFTGRLF